MRCFAIVLTVEIDHVDASPDPDGWDWSELLGVSAANALRVVEITDEPCDDDVDAFLLAADSFAEDLSLSGLTVTEEA
jgi:hypothetical protein